MGKSIKDEKGLKKESIVAYRVGDNLLCPECYEMSKEILAVHKIELPAKPIKRGDIGSFVCKHCEATKGSSDIEITPDVKVSIEKTSSKESQITTEENEGKDLDRADVARQKKDLTDLEDMIDHCINKITFISDFFVQSPPGYQPELSADGKSGLVYILENIEDDLTFVSKEIDERRQKGLIIEVSEEMT